MLEMACLHHFQVLPMGLFHKNPCCSLMRTLTSSTAHCSVISGKLVFNQATTGRDPAGCLQEGGRKGKEGCGDWQPAAGGVATRSPLIAKLRNSRSLYNVVLHFYFYRTGGY